MQLPPVFIDLETCSLCDLSKEGGRRYACHPSTRILTAAALFDGKALIWLPFLDAPPSFEVGWPEGFGPALPIEVYVGQALPSPLADAIRAGRPFAAHNAFGFEAFVWAAQRLPAPATWIDTLPWARAAGCPGSLDAASCWLLGLNKDKAGAKLLARYTQPFGKDRKFRDIPPDHLAALVRYNLIDTLLLAKLYPLLVHRDGEPDLVRLDRAINTRGVRVDHTLARAALALEANESARLAREAEQVTGGAIKVADLTRPLYLGAWLESRGLPMSRTEKGNLSLTKEAADNLLRRKDLPEDTRAVLLARRAIGRVTTKKLRKALAFCATDGRLRDQFLYHTAHTGRWTGHQAQLQNIPKPHEKLKDLTPLIESVHDAAAFRAALPEEVSFSDGLSALLRPCFVAGPGKTLLIADFASIEARGVAWLANEESQLTAFRQGRDLYCELAVTIFGRPVSKKDTRERAVGKQAILGCQYSLGPDRFDSTCKHNGVDLAAAGVTAEQVVEAYRDAYPKIAGYPRPDGFGRTGGIWKTYEFAALATVQSGRSRQAGGCLFAKEKDALVVTLPSGRRSYFRNARIEKRVPGYGGNAKPTLVYDSPGRNDRDPKKKGAKKGKGGYGWEDATYGGKLTENITQAMCRDLLAGAMLRCEQAGLPVVIHTHDEVGVEVPVADAEDALRRLLAIMSQVPAWAEGFPIEVEGYTSFRYLKGPPPGALTIKARDGVVLEEVRIPGTPPSPPSFQPFSLPVTGREDGKNMTPPPLSVTVEDNGPGAPPPLPPATADDQAHNGMVLVPPSPSPPVPPPTLPPAPIALPPTVSDRPRRKTTAAPRPGRQKTISPPLKRHGGKTYLASRIISLMPPHVHYVEPFAGGAAVLLARDPNDPRFFLSDHRDHQGVSEVINDLDGRLTNFWRVIGDMESFASFQRRVEALPLSRPEFEAAKAHEYGNDPVADAVAFFVENRQSRQALGKDFVTHVKSRVRRGMNDHASAWLSAVEGLPAIHERLKRVVVENRPALDVIREHDSAGTFFYLDPPYVHETRTVTDAYGDFEMTVADHRELLDVLLHCQGKVMLSGYANELYDGMLAGWVRHEFDLPNNAASGKEKRRMTEVIWCNFGSGGDGR
jgi:site-specific DNA-adenine methylase